MKFHFKGDRFLKYFFFFLAFLIVSLVGCLLYLKYVMHQQIQSANEKYQSYLLADELRQSSDDLTKMVRLYLVTGEVKYKNDFYEILAIRNGESPRPVNYHQIYWDLVTDGTRPRPFGSAVSLKELMIQHHFTLEEFNLLETAQQSSDELAVLEKKAMDMVEKSGFDPAVQKKAEQLVFDDNYMKIKAKIMAPLQEFLEHVEDRTQKRASQLNEEALGIVLVAILLASFATIVMLISIFKALRALEKMTTENEMLLLNVLPSPIAERLKGGEEPIADEYNQASVLFADIVKFTEMTYKLGGKKMVGLLNQLFDEFDNLTEKYGVEKVKTIGDNYMAVSGVPMPVADHAVRMADFALGMLKKLEEFNADQHLEFKLRIGMNYGPVVAGVIGHKKFIYDLWGDVVNVASRMESTAPEGQIQVTEKMALMLSESFDVVEREIIDIKGKGPMKTFLLKGRK